MRLLSVYQTQTLAADADALCGAGRDADMRTMLGRQRDRVWHGMHISL